MSTFLSIVSFLLFIKPRPPKTPPASPESRSILVNANGRFYGIIEVTQ